MSTCRYGRIYIVRMLQMQIFFLPLSLTSSVVEKGRLKLNRFLASYHNFGRKIIIICFFIQIIGEWLKF